jgi:uncharacterized membrane protein
MIKKILYLLSGAACFFIFAQSASAYSISPVKYLITIDPGKTETATIKIKNEEPMPLTFKLKVMGLSQDAQGKPVITNQADGAGTWVKPEADSVSVDPGNTAEAKYLITAPADAKSGSYYLALAIEPVVPEGTGISISSRLVSLLTLQVAGMVQESLEIKKWQPASGVFRQKDNWKFNLNIANKGNIEVVMKGTLSIKNWRGQEIMSEDKKLGNTLLSGAERSLTIDSGPQKANIYLPGLYQAKIKVLYGRTGQTIVDSVNFWYLPNWIWWVLGGIILLIILIIVAIKRARR